MELIKDYDCTIEYHPRKANVIVNALSRKFSGSLSAMDELRSMDVALAVDDMGVLLANLRIRPIMVERIKAAQDRDEFLKKIKEGIRKRKTYQRSYRMMDDGTLMVGNRVCVPEVDQIRQEIMEEAHCAAYALHPGSTKMYRNLRDSYWWPGMKKDVANYVAKCSVCQQIKTEHQVPMGPLHPLPIPEWK